MTSMLTAIVPTIMMTMIMMKMRVDLQLIPPRDQQYQEEEAPKTCHVPTRIANNNNNINN